MNIIPVLYMSFSFSYSHFYKTIIIIKNNNLLLTDTDAQQLIQVDCKLR